MTPDFDDLLAKAKAATPGPWRQVVDGQSGPLAIVRSENRPHGYQLHNMEDVKRTDPDVWPHMKDTYRRDATYIAAASPDVIRALVLRLRRAEDTVEGLTADLQLAVEVAFKRGAREWARLNYPKEHARLVEGETASGDTQAPLLNADDTQADTTEGGE